MKTTDFVIIFVIALVVFLFFIYQFEIIIENYQIIAILILAFIPLAILFLLQKTQKPKKEMKRAEEYAKTYWKEKTGEDTTWLDVEAIKRIFSDTSFYAFTFHRKEGTRTGIPVVIVVEKPKDPHTPFDIAYLKENPNEEIVEDPFSRIKGYLIGSPVRHPVAEPIPTRYGKAASPVTVKVSRDSEEKKEDDEIKKLGGG